MARCRGAEAFVNTCLDLSNMAALAPDKVDAFAPLKCLNGLNGVSSFLEA